MRYLHTMVRITNIEDALDFYCTKLGLVETHRHDNDAGRYTNVFLNAPGDTELAKTNNAPLLELTFNWAPEDGSEPEMYTGGRNFGHLAYEVDNIYETCQKLMDAGVVINRAPKEGRMAFIKSPEGVSVELLQAGEALPIEEPWASMPNEGSW